MSIGDRLREERTRLGRNQDEFALIGGVQRRAQSNYERDERCPDADYLSRIGAVGADVNYIVTGKRVGQADAEREAQRMANAWETLELALAHVGRTLTPEKKRKAAEALYQASRADTSGQKSAEITELVLQLAA